MNLRHLFVALGLSLSLSAMAQSARQDLFTTSADARIPYRIPAIAQAHSGQVIVVSDYRWNKGDIGWSPELFGSRIDLKYRLSPDGVAFGPEHTLVLGSGAADPATAGFGDAALVADYESADVLMISVMGNISWGDTRADHRMQTALFLSHDNGTTWSAPTDLTPAIYGLYDNLQGLFFGSGKLYQSHCYRIGTHRRVYAPLLAKGEGNMVVYTDDFGRTWHALGGPQARPCPKGDEPKVVELPNGNLLLSSRTDGGRFYNIFRYDDVKAGTGSWQQPVLSNHANRGVAALDNACNGGVELVRALRKSDRTPVYLLLQSLPFGPQRRNVGIYYKEFALDATFDNPADIAADWDGRFQVSQVASAYSEILPLQNGLIAFIFEELTHGTDYTIAYRLLTLEEITHGQYSLEPYDVKR
ncbi:MAG: exo-alpha-sialidase [Alloprevotella sp.]|nr:exo-alpha-sialidase [Alloprevotella sp.]